MFQYIGVSRMDQKGIVQVGVEPEKLNKALANNTIDKALKDIDYGIKGFIFAVNTKTGLMEMGASTGTTYQQYGIPDKWLTKENVFTVAKINQQKVYVAAEKYNDYFIGLALPTQELYQSRMIQVITFMIICLIIFIALILIINSFVKNQVVDGIQKIIQKLQQITSGDLEVEVDIYTNQEFYDLSTNINQMVSSIKQNMQKSKTLVQEQEDIVERVKKIAVSLSNTSNQTYHASETIAEDAVTQKQYVTTLLSDMESLLEKSQRVKIFLIK